MKYKCDRCGSIAVNKSSYDVWFPFMAKHFKQIHVIELGGTETIINGDECDGLFYPYYEEEVEIGK